MRGFHYTNEGLPEGPPVDEAQPMFKGGYHLDTSALQDATSWANLASILEGWARNFRQLQRHGRAVPFWWATLDMDEESNNSPLISVEAFTQDAKVAEKLDFRVDEDYI